MRRLSRLALLLLALAGCASTPPAPPRELPALPLAPASFGAELQLVQRLTVEYADREPQQLDALLEIDAQELRLAGLVLGERVLTLRYDGQRLEATRHPLLPELISAERVLRDLQLTLWPLAPLQAALPAGWTLEDAGALRRLRQDGETVVEIRYAGTPRGPGHADFRNLRQGYRLLIDSIAP